MAQHIANLAGILQNIQMPPGVQPHIVDLPLPPKLEGALAPNDFLTRAKKHAFNKVFGPESMVVYKGYVYTGQADGWVVEISPFGRIRKLARLAQPSCERSRVVGACGRPMGIRVDGLGYLIVADAYKGIFKINPKSGRYRQLVSPRVWVNKRPLGYINDLAVTKNGIIFFSSSSSKWTLAKENNIIFEGENSGRVLFYNPRERRLDKQVGELVTNMSFPNGVELSKDESYLLVGEGTLSRIHRIWLGPKPPKPERIEVFASNLPGVVDNIRLSPRGTYWVGLFQSRHRGLPSVMDTFGRKPNTRGALITLMNSKVAFDDPPFGIVVEVNALGQVTRSLQDPQGKMYTGVSEVYEDPGGILFFASPDKAFVGFMKLPPAPTPLPSGSGTGTGSPGGANTGSPGTSAGAGGSSGSTRPTGTAGTGTGTGTGTAPATTGTGMGTGTTVTGTGIGSGFQPQLSQNPKVIAFLLKIRDNIMKMTARRIKQVILELVKQLIMVKRQSIFLQRQAEAREDELRRMREALKRLQQDNALSTSAGTGSGSGPATTAAPAATNTTTITATPSEGGPGTAETTATTTTDSSGGGGAGGTPTAAPTQPSTTTAAAASTSGGSSPGSTTPSMGGGGGGSPGGSSAGTTLSGSATGAPSTTASAGQGATTASATPTTAAGAGGAGGSAETTAAATTDAATTAAAATAAAAAIASTSTTAAATTTDAATTAAAATAAAATASTYTTVAATSDSTSTVVSTADTTITTTAAAETTTTAEPTTTLLAE